MLVNQTSPDTFQVLVEHVRWSTGTHTWLGALLGLVYQQHEVVTWTTGAVDPAPAYPAATPTAELRTTLLNEDAEIFDRYRALFALRNQGTAAAVEALGASFTGNSALLKHEVAYVLGQMQDKHAVDTLRLVMSSFLLPRKACSMSRMLHLCISHYAFCAQQPPGSVF